jgi:two-component system nitrate/nitrite response regulator NarL
MIRVLIVHEFQLMCNIISAALDDEEDIQAVGTATNVAGALELVQKENVDIVLVSTGLPNDEALTLTKSILQTAPKVKIVVLGITEDRGQVLQFIEAGADGYVLQEDSLEDLLAAVRAAHAGKALISPQIASALIDRVTELAHAFTKIGTAPPEAIELTEREIEVLELISQNLNNQEIAERLVIEVGTVKNHVHSILRKLGVDKREQAASLLGWIKGKEKPLD